MAVTSGCQNRIDNIIIIADEAHRSQYKVMVQNIQRALPNALKIGFTGTPILFDTVIQRFDNQVYFLFREDLNEIQSNMRTITAHDDILRYSRNSKLKITKEWNKGTQ
jgi:type I site-specific restriction-modification system R (restriction) subunit